MMQTRGRNLALLAAGGVVGVVALALVFLEDMVMAYHLYRLRADPQLVLELVEAPEGSPREAAARAFAKTPEGQRVLVEEIRYVVLDKVLSADVRTTVLEGLVWLGDGYASYFQWGRRFVGRYGIELGNIDAARLRRTASVLETLDGAECTLPEYPQLHFTFLRGASAVTSLAPPFRREATSLPAPGQLACLIRREAKASVPILVAILSDKFTTTRVDAAAALGRIGPGAKEAISALEAILNEDLIEFYPQVREAVTDALDKVRGP